MSMKWESIKKDSDFNIAASIITRVDGQIKSIGLLDDNGEPVEIVLDSYSLKILVPAAPKLVKKYAVRGQVLGIQIDETFDNQYEANERVTAIERSTISHNGLVFDVVVSEVEVPEEE